MSAERDSEKPVALFNGYADWPRRKGKPDVYSSLQVLAASELLRQGEIEAAVFTTGPIKPGEPNIADRMAKQLQRNLVHMSENNVFVQIPKATSTRAEVEEFKKIARELGWNNLIIVGKEAHQKRIERAARRKFGRESKNIPIITTESILQEKGNTRYLHIIEKVKNSPQEQGFIRREKFIDLIDGIPFVGGTILDFIDKMLKNKNWEILVAKMLSRK